MSKKLVKTAKHQFEERLRELGNHVAEEINGETFHSSIDKEGHFHILRIGDADIEYSEFDYGCTLLELYNNEVFLDKLATEFAIGREGIKPILEWWSDAEKNHEPFTMADIVQFAPVKSFVEFEDLYEEVPDMRIITAKEQWEKDTDGLIAVRKNEGKSLFVNITVSAVKFYDNYDGYACYSYPSLDEMRKDSFFVSRVVDELMRSANHNKIGDFMEWVREGDDFPLNPAVIYESEYQGFTFMKYEDKEESTEKADNRTVMNMYDPFNWLRIEGSGTWEWISEFCNDVNEYGRLDVLYDIIDGELDVKNKFENPPTMKEIKADYEQSFPLMLAGVFENLAKDIRKGELKFKMDYRKL